MNVGKRCPYPTRRGCDEPGGCLDNKCDGDDRGSLASGAVPAWIRLSAVACLPAIATTGCGSSGTDERAPAAPPASARAQAFPKAAGLTMTKLEAKLPEGPIFSPTVSVLNAGRQRVGFALFDVARKQITGAGVALYVARADGGGLRGPYVARSESLAVKPQFASQTTAHDPDAAKSVYVADVPFKKTDAGAVTVIAVARMDGRLLTAGPRTMEVGVKGAQPPDVGQAAVRTHTPTVASVGGDASTISTRVPPATDLLRSDLADVLGRKPVVVAFATPQLCSSRVCGPVVDVVEQVKDATGDKAAFIHQEIYNDNAAGKGFRPQVRAYRLPTEPWVFVIDRAGKVSARFEGAVSTSELQRAVETVTGGGR